jgi:hypothetical protein
MPTTTRSTTTARKTEPAAKSEPARNINVLGVPVPVPNTGTALYYGGIAALVAVELIDWPVALAVALGHELLTHRKKPVA